jgi:zinc transport system substrate-binding protein
MPKSFHLLAASLAASALALSACATPDTGATTDGTLDVVVAFYPLQFVAERIGGTEAQVTNLTQPGAEAHDVELTPRQIAMLSEADLVLYEKGFQPAVDAAITQANPRNVVDITTVVEMHPITDSGEHVHEQDEHAGESPEEHAEHADTAPAEKDAHGDGGIDPHVWLDPTRLVTISDTVAQSLGEAQPDKAAAFRTNATDLNDELIRLDESFRTGLQDCKRREFVVSHAAFGYIADRYQLTQIPLRGLSPDQEPSPARIAEVQELARERGVTTIFYETLVSPAVAESVAGDLGLKTDVLDPLEGLTEASRGKNYLEVMNANLTSLKAANECQ